MQNTQHFTIELCGCFNIAEYGSCNKLNHVDISLKYKNVMAGRLQCTSVKWLYLHSAPVELVEEQILTGSMKTMCRQEDKEVYCHLALALGVPPQHHSHRDGLGGKQCRISNNNCLGHTLKESYQKSQFLFFFFK